MNPKVSVLMITYNHEEFIAQAVASVLGQQTDFDFEIVVGEDCSTDRTREILLDLQASYPQKLRLLLRDHNLGGRRNLIDTFRSCRGEYIAILEGDDYWTSPQKLQKQAGFLDNHPQCSICFHPVMKRYEDRDDSMQFHGPCPLQDLYTIEDLLERTLIVTCSVMFRNRLFDDFPPWFYSVPAGDWPLNIINAQYGNIGYLDEAMAVYRVHSGGLWSSRDMVSRLQGKLEILKTLREHLDPSYTRILDGSIAQTHLRVIKALAQGKNYKGLYSHLSQVLFDERIAATSLVSAGLRVLWYRMR